ncbi:MAG: AAA family ATPase [Chitinophagales bacterium]|nr:AAA family ATPase [Chitinophagales bacterium]
MRIKNLRLKNFRRFTDLGIDEIPEKAKLVLLIGSNGAGKSCIFDAFEGLNKAQKGEQLPVDYYKKRSDSDFLISVGFEHEQFWDISISNARPHADGLHKINFYGRTSFRQVPRLTKTSLGGNIINLAKDADRPKYFIDRDERFENDIEHITSIILRDFFRMPDAQSKIRESYIDPINRALTNIFGEKNGTKLELIEIIPPLEGNIAQVTFRKGDSEFHYNHLSAGEKEVINILINLSSRRASIENAVCYFDEIDLHLNTKLQYNLLKEIVTNWIPESSQFWTASHSLGFIDFARNSPDAVIIDFDDLDFDLPRNLVPVPSENLEVYEIAVGKEFLPSLLSGKKLCFVENNDRDYYASLGLKDVLFAKATNRNNVFHKVLNDPNAIGIVDRDFLSDDDIQLIRAQYKNLYILPYYSIENLLYHPENLVEYFATTDQSFDSNSYISQLKSSKEKVVPTLIPSLALKRTEYPYFGEQVFSDKPTQNRFKNKKENSEQATILAAAMQSDDFETWYKVFPMKAYATDLPQRQNIPKSELVKTIWFKQKISNLLAV